jgi:hypothetical protein
MTLEIMPKIIYFVSKCISLASEGHIQSAAFVPLRGAFRMRAHRTTGGASQIMQQSCHPHDQTIGVFLLCQVQGEMIDPVDVLEAMRQVAEIGEASLHLLRHLCQQVDCLVGDFLDIGFLLLSI